MHKKTVTAAIAKDQLKIIDRELSEPHILIGGLAVQQYHPPRASKDIDLICDDRTAKRLIDKLYPTKHYDISETNEDDLRPAYIISSRINDDKVIFIGPKITEREPYNYIDWEKLKKEAQEFRYKNIKLKNIKVPCIEMLAFTKFLSFLNRIIVNIIKGENDLMDFINLSNHKNFRTNYFIDLIRKEECEAFIKESLYSCKGRYDHCKWENSLLSDYFDIVGPAISKAYISQRDNSNEKLFHKIYSTENSIIFYDQIASDYDRRNTSFLYAGHQAIINRIISILPSGGSIIDFGCGTGRLIAAHFIHDEKIKWVGVDGSKKMLEQFKIHTMNSLMKVELLHTDILDMDWDMLKESDLCLICFTLSSLSSINCIDKIATKVKHDGFLLIADIHPVRTIKSPYYDFDIENIGKIALTPIPIYPDFVLEKLIMNGFILEQYASINDEIGEAYAFISVFRKIE